MRTGPRRRLSDFCGLPCPKNCSPASRHPAALLLVDVSRRVGCFVSGQHLADAGDAAVWARDHGKQADGKERATRQTQLCEFDITSRGTSIWGENGRTDEDTTA